jgi:hypothetical protein
MIIKKIALLLLIATLFTACGGGGGSTEPESSEQSEVQNDSNSNVENDTKVQDKTEIEALTQNEPSDNKNLLDKEDNFKNDDDILVKEPKDDEVTVIEVIKQPTRTSSGVPLPPFPITSVIENPPSF